MQEDLIKTPESTQNVYMCCNKNGNISTEAACYGFKHY